jgi:hypothetical protein
MMAVRAQHGGGNLKPAKLAVAGAGLPCVTVEAFDASRFGAWNEMVGRFSNASFFHGSAWMEVLQASYGFRPIGLVFRRGEAVVGLIPFVEVLSRFTGRRSVSLPFADECPPLVPTGVATDNLLHALVEFTRAQGWDFFEVRGSNDGLRPDLPSVRFHGHRIDLPPDVGTLWERLKSPVRTGVRKAESAGVTVEFSTSRDAPREFPHPYPLTRQRHGLPPQPISFFQAVHHRILSTGSGQIVLARSAGRCLAGAVFFDRGERALFKYGAFDARFQSVRANNMVFWEALKHYVKKGCTAMELGRTSLRNDGLRRFKQGWASVEYPIEYAKFDLRENRFVEEKDMAAGWYNWAFRLAPRWVSGLVGKVLYKHWA